MDKVKANGLKETGIIYSKDSSDLVSHFSTLAKLSAKYITDDIGFNFTLDNLEPYTKYWFLIYFKDHIDTITYSRVYSVCTNGFNIRWRDNFSKMAVKGQSIYFLGDNVDTIKNNYKTLYEGINCSLLKIASYDNKLFEYDVLIPFSANLGHHRFEVYYKGKVVFGDDLEILKGAFCEIGSHPTQGGFSNNFCYNNEIYVYYAPHDYISFLKWSPQTNQWTQLSPPNIIPSLPEYEQGYEINGKIYFPPISWNTLIGVFGAKGNDDEKYIYSYDPNLNIWEKNALITSDTVPQYTGLYSSFVYKDKLYCFIVHNNGDSKNIYLLKMFDPSDNSWKTVMDSVPFNEAWGCKATVLNDKIYVLASLVRKQEWATTYFKNELYVLDLETKTYTKKSIWDNPDIGSINGYLFGYKDHLYFYGGEYGTGFFHSPEYRSLEYDPEIDRWFPLSSCYIPTYIKSTYGAFLYKIYDKIYVGFGQGNKIYEYILD
jgi:hypothetical protein